MKFEDLINEMESMSYDSGHDRSIADVSTHATHHTAPPEASINSRSFKDFENFTDRVSDKDMHLDMNNDKKIDTDELKRYVNWTAKKLGVPQEIALAVVERESNWNQNDVSRNRNGTRDVGLMQLNSSNRKYFEDKFWTPDHHGIKFNPMNPEHNVEVGIKYLKWLNTYFDGDWGKAIMGYNAGPGNVKRDTIPDSTRNYLKFVMDFVGDKAKKYFG
jgi:hypothetical protein